MLSLFLTKSLARNPSLYKLYSLKQKSKSPTKNHRGLGAGNVTRTHDLLITNQLLYRLSYASAFSLVNG